MAIKMRITNVEAVPQEEAGVKLTVEFFDSASPTQVLYTNTPGGRVGPDRLASLLQFLEAAKQDARAVLQARRLLAEAATLVGREYPVE